MSWSYIARMTAGNQRQAALPSESAPEVTLEGHMSSIGPPAGSMRASYRLEKLKVDLGCEERSSTTQTPVALRAAQRQRTGGVYRQEAHAHAGNDGVPLKGLP